MNTALFFEDMIPGEEHVTPARTVTEADVVTFAGLTGDYNRLHIDSEFAAQTPYGERIAHGLLVMSMAAGLSTRLRISEDLQPNHLGLIEVRSRWLAPTKFGDTIRVRVTIAECTPTSKPERGIVHLRRDVLNQRDEVVMESEWKLFVRRRTDEPA